MLSFNENDNMYICIIYTKVHAYKIQDICSITITYIHTYICTVVTYVILVIIIQFNFSLMQLLLLSAGHTTYKCENFHFCYFALCPNNCMHHRPQMTLNPIVQNII